MWGCTCRKYVRLNSNIMIKNISKIFKNLQTTNERKEKKESFVSYLLLNIPNTHIYTQTKGKKLYEHSSIFLLCPSSKLHKGSTDLMSTSLNNHVFIT